jgi:hypothetical protein
MSLDVFAYPTGPSGPHNQPPGTFANGRQVGSPGTSYFAVPSYGGPALQVPYIAGQDVNYIANPTECAPV